MRYHKIAVIPGDLNGKTVTDATLEVVRHLRPYLTTGIRHHTKPYSAEFLYREKIEELQPEHITDLGKHDAIFLGAVGNPKSRLKPGIAENGIIIKIRQALDQYVNHRPIKLPHGVPSILANKGPDDIDFIICRENSEGMYSGKGSLLHEGTPQAVAEQIMTCTYEAVKRLAMYAQELALERNKSDNPTLHVVFKTNIFKYAGPIWQQVQKEAEQVPGLTVKYEHIDAFVMKMVRTPEIFDVVITENMMGDIATDLGAELQGSIGTAVSGNLDPTRTNPSMFEPIHGSAPDRWYTDKGRYKKSLVQTVRPEAAFLSYAMMLEFIGEQEAADVLTAAAHANIRHPDYVNQKLDELVANAIATIKSQAA